MMTALIGTLILFGDSHTAPNGGGGCVPQFPCYGFSYQLSASKHSNVHVRAYPGYPLFVFANSAEPFNSSVAPVVGGNTVWMMFGTNDGHWGRSWKQLLSDYHTVADRLYAAGAAAVVISPPPPQWGRDRPSWNFEQYYKAAVQACWREDIVCGPNTWALLTEEHIPDWDTQGHLNQAGHDVLASALRRFFGLTPRKRCHTHFEH